MHQVPNSIINLRIMKLKDDWDYLYLNILFGAPKMEPCKAKLKTSILSIWWYQRFYAILQPKSANEIGWLLVYGKGKEIPLQASTGPWGFQGVEAPIFQDNWHMKVVRLSALCTGRLYPPGNISCTHYENRKYVNEKFQWHHRESNL